MAENCFHSLDAPVMRVGAVDSFVPSAATLEAEVLPSAADVQAAVEKLLAH